MVVLLCWKILTGPRLPPLSHHIGFRHGFRFIGSPTYIVLNESIVKQLANKVGELVAVEMKAIAARGGDFLRARVNLDARKPLVRFVTLSPEGKDDLLLLVKFEKIPRFYARALWSDGPCAP